eukprot:gene9764-biopygen1710
MRSDRGLSGRVEQHKTEPNQTEPNRTEPNRTEPNRTERNQTKPSSGGGSRKLVQLVDKEKRLRTRPGRVRFFKIYRVGRFRDASAGEVLYGGCGAGGAVGAVEAGGAAGSAGPAGPAGWAGPAGPNFELKN